MAHPDFYTNGKFNEKLISLMSAENRMGILWDYFVLAYEQFTNITWDSSTRKLHIHNNSDDPQIYLGPSEIIDQNDETIIRKYPDYMDLWQNFIVTKHTKHAQGHQDITNLLAEATVLKLLGDIGVGVPCNITPVVQLDNGWETNIFVARDNDTGGVMIIMNRMSCDLQSANSPDIGWDLYNNLFTPDTTPLQIGVENQLVTKIEKMVQFGITCTDHKPQNVLVISSSMMNDANNTTRNYRGITSATNSGLSSEDILNVSKPSTPYGVDFEYNVYLADFDPEHCCRLMGFIHDMYTHGLYTLGIEDNVSNIACGVHKDDISLYINLSLGMIATVTTPDPLGDAFLRPYVGELYKYIQYIEDSYKSTNKLPEQIYVDNILHYFKTFAKSFRDHFPILNKRYGSSKKRSRSRSNQGNSNKRIR
uniref:Protein kinase domain-containing protein n=1 Tax=viral metagenome TaxID=1070528 RepID=A0A6C0LTC1_9ZZZZ